jgi:DNA repair and recombination protein RAD54B
VAAIEKRIVDEAEKKRSKISKGKMKMQALMRYIHVDTSIFTGKTVDVFGYERTEVTHAKDVLDDEVLIEVLKDERCKVGYVFAKKG